MPPLMTTLIITITILITTKLKGFTNGDRNETFMYDDNRRVNAVLNY